MLKSAPVCWVGGVIPKQLKASAASHVVETLGMGALEWERPSAGSNGPCSIKSGKKNLPFGAWSQGGLGFFPLPSEQRGTDMQGGSKLPELYITSFPILASTSPFPVHLHCRNGDDPTLMEVHHRLMPPQGA